MYSACWLYYSFRGLLMYLLMLIFIELERSAIRFEEARKRSSGCAHAWLCFRRGNSIDDGLPMIDCAVLTEVVCNALLISVYSIFIQFIKEESTGIGVIAAYHRSQALHFMDKPSLWALCSRSKLPSRSWSANPSLGSRYSSRTGKPFMLSLRLLFDPVCAKHSSPARAKNHQLVSRPA